MAYVNVFYCSPVKTVGLIRKITHMGNYYSISFTETDYWIIDLGLAELYDLR